MLYVASLDGIRALAILAVLIFHIWPWALPGGFTGVDVFFVLSGFLITSIILHDLREGSFSLREFYLRRIQRLLPNVVATVLAILVLWTLFMLPSQVRLPGQHALWTLGNLSNLFILNNLGGYWGEAAELSPLTHTWSLAIEEQFYLLFPSTLLLLRRLQPGRIIAWLVTGTVLSFALCVYGTYHHPAATFYLLPTRVWELLIGAALATYRTPLSGSIAMPRFLLSTRSQEIAGFAGLAITLASFALIDGSNFPGVVSLGPTIGTVLILISVADEKTWLSRWFSTAFLVMTGKLSYSLYLWHWPLITFGKNMAYLYGLPHNYGAVGGAVAGIVLSCLAYATVEQPLRKRGSRRFERFGIIAAGFTFVALCAVSVTLRPRVADPDQRFNQQTFSGDLYTVGKLGQLWFKTNVGFYDVKIPEQAERSPGEYLWRKGGVVHLYGGDRPRVVLLGSSHGVMFSRVIDDICRDLRLSVAFLSLYQTPAFFVSTANTNFATETEAHQFDEMRRKLLREWRPDILLLIDRWDGRGITAEQFDADLRAFLREVSPTSRHILFAAQVPGLKGFERFNLREFVDWKIRMERKLPRFVPDENEIFRRRVISIAEAARSEFPSLRVLRTDAPYYTQDGSIRVTSGRDFLYADAQHLTDRGTDLVRHIFQNAIAQAAGEYAVRAIR